MIELRLTKRLRGQEGEFEFACDICEQGSGLISIFGASGSGKSTLLRMIAGLERADDGYIAINGEVWFDSSAKIDLSPQQRKTGFVFQEYSLFPNMSVIENILFAQPNKNPVEAARLLELVELVALKDAHIGTLSGGQKQRVAIARALARAPQILLLDEPFSALDSSVKHKLQDELLKLKKEIDIPILFVSHDKEEVFRLSDKVGIVKDGMVKGVTPPEEAFFDSKVSGKFSFYGRILSIKKADIAYLAYISVGGQIVQVLLTTRDLEEFGVGDEVLVAAKAFNPIIKKV